MQHESTTKECRRCHVHKLESEFWKQKRARDGLQSYCKPCVNAVSKERYRRDPDAYRNRAAELAYYAEHREQIIARVRDRYWSDPESSRAASRGRSARYRQRHPDRCSAAIRRYLARRPDKRREWNRTKRLRRRARQASAPGRCTAVQEQARWDFYGGLCWMCGAAANTTDHVVAIARGGSNWPANLRPACSGCNAAKGDRDWRFLK